LYKENRFITVLEIEKTPLYGGVFFGIETVKFQYQYQYQLQ